jgi:MoaD family protein
MMNIKVQYYALIRELVKKEEEGVELAEGSSLRDLLEQLTKEYGADFKNLFFERNGDVAHRILMFVDGIEVDLAKDGNRRLKNGTRVQFFQPVGGG